MLLSFLNYPNEGIVVGRILAGYGELEYQLSHCVSAAVSERESIFRAFFRMRGEEQRIDVSDALMRHHYEKVGLKAQYEEMISAMRWCKRIRNQYAHCHWAGFTGDNGLFFTNMEVSAKSRDGRISFKMCKVDEALLTEQEGYFEYTFAWLLFLHGRMNMARGSSAPIEMDAPTTISRPLLHYPSETHPYRSKKESASVRIESGET